MSHRLRPIVLLAVPLSLIAPPEAPGQSLERVRVADDTQSFVLEPSGKSFRPVGFNYDHDGPGRLIEDYWHDEWPMVEADVREMKGLGANVVRVHLQFGRFMNAPDEPNPAQLDRLGDLLDLAERVGLYLDLTGLGCYHKQDVPAWYDTLSEADRWAAQAAFWKAVAGRCAGRSVVFCYDLMNEPVVPGRERDPGDWLGPGFGDKHFVQFITLDPTDRPRPEVARSWIQTLTEAIRTVDAHTMITVGLVPWSLDRPGLSSGFVPEAIVEDLDFIAVHLYPESGKVDEAIETLRGFQVGKPIVIEETFPLKAGPEDFERFLQDAEPIASGFIGFYWGTTPEELRPPKTIGEALLLSWLDLFQEHLAPLAEGSNPNP
ncbi:cellulase family glycosylhydrolase [Tautonia rosea]|uniref:cellulase family glycosylhydrolase n=1 Tax=Tautonia rosea TaxID=2728037 RepID=UPI0014753BEE|nr:cellulase family glycosylhydrolase [Tautonia rosea]